MLWGGDGTARIAQFPGSATNRYTVVDNEELGLNQMEQGRYHGGNHRTGCLPVARTLQKDRYVSLVSDDTAESSSAPEFLFDRSNSTLTWMEASSSASHT